MAFLECIHPSSDAILVQGNARHRDLGFTRDRDGSAANLSEAIGEPATPERKHGGYHAVRVGLDATNARAIYLRDGGVTGDA